MCFNLPAEHASADHVCRQQSWSSSSSSSSTFLFLSSLFCFALTLVQDLDGNPLPDDTSITLENVVFSSPFTAILDVIVQPFSSSLDVVIVISPVSEQATVLISAQIPEGVTGFQLSFIDSLLQTVAIAPDGHTLLVPSPSLFEILASSSSIAVFSPSGSTIPSSSSMLASLIEIQLADSAIGAGEEICLEDAIFTNFLNEEFPVNFDCSLPPPPADVTLSVSPVVESMVQVDIETTVTISSLQFDLVPEDSAAIGGLEIQSAELTVSGALASSSFNGATVLAFLLNIGADDTASILFDLVVMKYNDRQ